MRDFGCWPALGGQALPEGWRGVNEQGDSFKGQGEHFTERKSAGDVNPDALDGLSDARTDLQKPGANRLNVGWEAKESFYRQRQSE